MHEQVTTDLPSPMPIDVEHFIRDQTFRVRCPPTPLEVLVDYAPDQRDIE